MAKKDEKTNEDVKKEDTFTGVEDKTTRDILKTAMILNDMINLQRQSPAEEIMTLATVKKMMEGNLIDPKNYFMAKITKDGRITIPSEFREVQGLEEGSIVQLMLVDAFSGNK